jgi:two-component system OmpR family response regulator
VAPLKKKILIVDDEPTITRLLKVVLEKTGRFEVACENAGLKALSAARTFSPDLAVLDVNIPDLGGGEISAQFKADAALKSLPIIFLTGAVSSEEAEGQFTIGDSSVVAKPINMEKLIACIDQNIAKK